MKDKLIQRVHETKPASAPPETRSLEGVTNVLIQSLASSGAQSAPQAQQGGGSAGNGGSTGAGSTAASTEGS